MRDAPYAEPTQNEPVVTHHHLHLDSDQDRNCRVRAKDAVTIRHPRHRTEVEREGTEDLPRIEPGAAGRTEVNSDVSCDGIHRRIIEGPAQRAADQIIAMNIAAEAEGRSGGRRRIDCESSSRPLLNEH